MACTFLLDEIDVRWVLAENRLEQLGPGFKVAELFRNDSGRGRRRSDAGEHVFNESHCQRGFPVAGRSGDDEVAGFRTIDNFPLRLKQGELLCS